jgi:hypothetical protein
MQGGGEAQHGIELQDQAQVAEVGKQAPRGVVGCRPVFAGPSNYIGVNPKVKCDVPQPSR